eukprot:jgi/Picre1/34466/NNA_001934.t1
MQLLWSKLHEDKEGWFPTNQLSHEAKEQGYKSVAHYLVLTHLSDQASAAPIDQLLGRERRRRKNKAPVSRSIAAEEQPAQGGEDLPSNRRRILRQAELPLQFQGERTRRKALEIASKPRLEKEITEIDIDEEERRTTNHNQGCQTMGIRLPVGEHDDIPASALYSNKPLTRHINTVTAVGSGPRKRQRAPRVGENLLPPKRPRGASTTKNSRQRSDPSHVSPTRYNLEQEEETGNLEGEEDACCSAELEEENVSPIANKKTRFLMQAAGHLVRHTA